MGPGDEASCALCCSKRKGSVVNTLSILNITGLAYFFIFLFSSSFVYRRTPKGMELVPWVGGGSSLLAKVEESERQDSTDSPPMYVCV